MSGALFAVSLTEGIRIAPIRLPVRVAVPPPEDAVAPAAIHSFLEASVRSHGVVFKDRGMLARKRRPGLRRKGQHTHAN